MNARQAAFVREYLVDLNATQAAIRAGYSEKTAGALGAENLRKPEIRSAVDEALKHRAERVEVKADDVLRELLRIALADPAQCFDENGNPLPIHKIPREARAFVAGVDMDELGQQIAKLKFWSKPHALEALGKHLKLFTEQIDVRLDKSFADILGQARERAKRRR